jgi:predicted alpha/beta hydrolase
VVIINTGAGVSQRFYAPFAAWLAERGFTVITYDYRGVGESRPFRLRGFEGRLRDWGLADFEGVLQFVTRVYPGRAVLVVGHSVGGQLLGFPESNGVVRGAVTVGSQSGYWGHWPMPRKVAMGALWHVMPAIAHAVGFLPGRLGLGQDLPLGVAVEWARWCRQRGYFTEDGVAMSGFERLRAPVLSFSFSDDPYAPRSAVDWLHRLFRSASVERRHIEPGSVGLAPVRHFGFFRPEFRGALWPQVVDFFQRVALPGQPIGSAPA